MKKVHLDDPDVGPSDWDSVCPSWAIIPGYTLKNPANAQLTAAVSLPLSMDTLTRRQRDVLYLIVQGSTNKEIARSLGLGEGTVKVHVAALFGKLGVHHRAAVAVAGARFLSPGALKSA